MHPFVHLSIGFWLYTALQCRSSMSSNCLVFHTSGGISSSPAAFLFLIFLRTESSSSCVNGPSLMSNCLLIILVIGSGVIFGGFPSKFSKCCFHSFILSCWFAALSFALAVFFLLLTSFIVCQAILDCLSSTEYPATTITDADYADDIAILANTPDQAETLLHSLERTAASIGLHVNAHKTEYMCYNQTGDISTLEGTPLKLVDKFTYLGSSVESTEKDIETRLTKAWTAINRLSTIWKSDLTDKMKRSFLQAAVTSILLYGCTTWTLTKRLEKKLDGNYTRMLRAILNKSWRQHPTRHQLYGHLPPITKTIQVRRTRHAGHCWRSRDELIRDVLLWIPTHGRAKAGRPARTYIQQLCEDTGCCPEDLPRAMNDREEWRKRVRDIRAASTIWWWWW